MDDAASKITVQFFAQGRYLRAETRTGSLREVRRALQNEGYVATIQAGAVRATQKGRKAR